MIFIIHSLDKTTEFLSEIPNFLSKEGLTGFEYCILQFPVTDIETIINRIQEYPYQSLILFLGHGASHSVYLPANPADSIKKPLINHSNFQILQGKHFISLSCRSTEFIEKNHVFEHGSTMMGFDDLPTHWQDVWAQREVDANAYLGITDKVLESYRDILVDVFKKALKDTLVDNKNFSFFYYRLRLYINTFITNVVKNKISDNPTLLANLLFELKQGVWMFGDSELSLHT